MMCVFKKIVKTRENFRIYVQILGPNSNFRTFQDKFQNFRTMPRPGTKRTHWQFKLHLWCFHISSYCKAH